MEDRLKKMDCEAELIKQIRMLMDADTTEDIDSTRQEVIDLGLADDEDDWIMKGFVAWTAVAKRLVAIQGEENLLGELKKAAEEKDVPGLERSIARAVELGIAEDEYKQYNPVYAELQSIEHVRNLTAKHKGDARTTKNF